MGQITQQMYGTAASAVQSYTYYALNTPNGQGRVQAVETLVGSTARQGMNYTYDPTGNILAITDTANGSQVQSFVYDELDRLKRYEVTGGSGGTWAPQWFEYDQHGNLTFIKNNNASGTVQRTYDNTEQRTVAEGCVYGALNPAHAPTAVTTNGTLTEYCYDSAGNMIERQTGSTVETLIYDPEHRLRLMVGGNASAGFAYNGDGGRVRATVNGVTTLYAGAIEYEIDGSTTTLTKHYDAGGQRVAVRNGASLNYLLNDHLGSTSVILKNNGGLWGELRYSAWGETRYSNGTIVTDRQFTGQINDGATGLYYYNARYYDPALHRFIQADTIVPDPSDPQTLNRFSYVNNNPVIYTDPTGHYMTAHDDGAALAGAGDDIPVPGADGLGETGPWAAGGISGASNWTMAFEGCLLGCSKTASALGNDITPQGGYVGKPATTASGAGCSFSADTPVMTIEGDQPISELEIGEWVVAYNEATGETGYYPIVAVWEHLDLQIVLLRIEGELIETTPEHPFFTVDGEWVAAGDLEIGTRIQSADGEGGIVQNLTIVHDPQPMYNLTVDVAHTFMVGEGQWIVHNDGCSFLPGADPQHHDFGTTLATKAKEFYNSLKFWEQRGTTIATTTIDGTDYVTVNSGAPSTVFNKIEQAAQASNMVYVPNTTTPKNSLEGHAERFLYNHFEGNLTAIGVSHREGPCPDGCKPFFEQQGFSNVWFWETWRVP